MKCDQAKNTTADTLLLAVVFLSQSYTFSVVAYGICWDHSRLHVIELRFFTKMKTSRVQTADQTSQSQQNAYPFIHETDVSWSSNFDHMMEELEFIRKDPILGKNKEREGIIEDEMVDGIITDSTNDALSLSKPVEMVNNWESCMLQFNVGGSWSWLMALATEQ